MTPQQQAFLDTIAWSEIGPALLAVSDRGYNVCVGSTAERPILFHDYSAHPRVRNLALNSDAAGRYQLMGRYFAPYKAELGLPDFGPTSQDTIALHQISECNALHLIAAGQIEDAITACSRIWASFPGSPYGQHTHPMGDLLRVYQAALTTTE